MRRKGRARSRTDSYQDVGAVQSPVTAPNDGTTMGE